MNLDRLCILRLRAVFFLVLLFSGLLKLEAACADDRNSDPCRDALVNSDLNIHSAYSNDIRLSRYVTEASYDQARKEAGGNAKIYGISIGANYDEYHKHAESASSDERFSLSVAQIYNMELVGLDAKSPGVYHDCTLRELAQSGLHLVPVGATQTDIAIAIKWVPRGPNEPPSIPIAWAGIDAKAAGLPLEATQGENIVVIKRPTEDKQIAINSPGFSDSFTLTPIPARLAIASCPERELLTVRPGTIIASVIGPNTHNPDPIRYPPRSCYQTPPGHTLLEVERQDYPGDDTHGGTPYCAQEVSCTPGNVRCWNIHLKRGCVVRTDWLDYFKSHGGNADNHALMCDSDFKPVWSDCAIAEQ
jgi:hypothetical protein